MRGGRLRSLWCGKYVWALGGALRHTGFRVCIWLELWIIDNQVKMPARRRRCRCHAIINAGAMAFERPQSKSRQIRTPSRQNWRLLCVGNLTLAMLKKNVLEK